MRSFKLVAVALFLLVVVARAADSDYDAFERWCIRHGKFYNALDEKSTRFAIFKDNLRFVNEENAKNNDHVLELNKFADMTHDEFKSRYLSNKFKSIEFPQLPGTSFHDELVPRRSFAKYSTNDLVVPSSIDWRKEGAVTYVRDQGSCGSCWAFSTIGAVEGINYIVTKNLTALSEQELVDCDKSNSGCNGGLMDYAFQFIIKNGGIDTESDYPYIAADGSCDENRRKKAHAVTIDGYEDVPQNDGESLLKAIAQQPVSVAIEAGGRAFQFYKSGIFSGSCGTDLDHGVLAVGYGTENGKDFIIVKNSWGPDWGEDGYIRLERIPEETGKCGINMMASYPTKNGPNPEPSPPHPPEPVSPPPPPPAGPEVCDEWSICPTGTTCCCAFKYKGICLSWGCCPLPSATCCSDGHHCCPSDHPICGRNACLKNANDVSDGVPMVMRIPSIPIDSRSVRASS